MSASSGIKAGAAYVELFLKDKLSRGLKRASARLISWGGSMQGMGMKIAAIGGAMAAPFLLAVKSFTAVGDALNKMSIRTGMGVEALSGLAFAAEQSGADLQTLEKGLIGMARTVLNADMGLAAAVDSLKMLGLEVDQLKGRSPQEQFTMLANAVSKIKDPSTRAALAMQVFGKAGQKLIPMMAGGAAGIRALQAEAARLGRTMTTEQAQAAADLADAWNRLKSIFAGVVQTVGGALAPMLLKVAAVVKDWGKNIVKIVRDNKAFIVTSFKVAVAVMAIGAGLLAAGTAVVGLGVVFGAAATIASGVATAFGAVLAAAGALLSPIGLVAAAVVGLGGYFAYTSGAAGSAIDWIKGKFSELGKWVGTVFDGIRNAMAAGDMALAGEVLMAALKMVWQKGVSSLTEAWAGFKDKILSIWSTATFKIAEWGVNAWAGLRSGWAEAVAGMKILWMGFTDTVQTGWERAQMAIGKGIAWIIAKTEGLDPEVVMADVQRQFDLKRDKRKAANQVEAEALARESQDKVKKIEGERKQALDSLKDQAEHDRKQREANRAAAAKQAQDDLDAARKSLDASLAKAKAKGAEKENRGAERPGNAPALPKPAQIAAAGASKAVGTFNAFAIGGMAAGNVQDRIAKATEKSAALLALMQRKRNRGKFTFTGADSPM